MSFTPEQPMSRRAAREAARLREAEQSTGSQPTVEPVDSAPTPVVESVEATAPPVQPPAPVPGAPAVVESPASLEAQAAQFTGEILSRRRLRELRTQATPIVQPPVVEPVEPVGAAAGLAPTEQPRPEEHAEETVVVERPQPAPVPPAPAPADDPAPSTPQPWSAPVGHWTRQMTAVEEDTAGSVGRQFGTVSPTTSTLILGDAKVVDLGGPLNATGEVLLTGSVPLAPEFARTGSLNAIADAELDDQFDATHATSAHDAQPVKASAIASQHALGTPIVANAKPRGSRSLTVLLVAASVLAVLVTGLVITAVVLHWI